MATYTRTLRQGLPRFVGGEPWPPPGTAHIRELDETQGERATAPISADAAEPAVSALSPAPDTRDSTSKPQASATTAQPTGKTVRRVLRRGLPRLVGGEPWPPATAADTTAAVNVTVAMPATAEPELQKTGAVPAGISPSMSKVPTLPRTPTSGGVPLRRGLPRISGAEPWPPAGWAPAAAVDPTIAAPANNVMDTATESAIPATLGNAEADLDVPAAKAEPSHRAVPNPTAASSPKRATAVTSTKQIREPVMIGSRTLGHWVKLALLGVLGVVTSAAIIVLAARGVTTLPGVPEFMARYHGEYEPTLDTEAGMPAWARWTHFFNFFLLVLIIRSGLLVRHQQKPPGYYTPKRGGKKISLYLWLHTSLDVLWLANGLVFVALLIATWHWARIVPTSWDVFPNAASALLQYLTLNWPVENGWVNYNSLQQLMYFIVVFIAAPLAAITGVRMSEWWPQNAEKLNRIYPAPIARAIHYPVMLFFVVFVIVHVFLVFATGTLRNLNHMFAGSDQISWVGFWWFVAGLAVTAVAVILARPLVLAPIASLFGKVSNR